MKMVRPLQVLFIILTVGIIQSLAAYTDSSLVADPGDCCVEKIVDMNKYILVEVKDQTWADSFGCASVCNYRRESDDGSRWCFGATGSSLVNSCLARSSTSPSSTLSSTPTTLATSTTSTTVTTTKTTSTTATTTTTTPTAPTVTTTQTTTKTMTTTTTVTTTKTTTTTTTFTTSTTKTTTATATTSTQQTTTASATLSTTTTKAATTLRTVGKYQLVQKTKSWSAAQTFCEVRGMTLATIRSQEEQDQINQLFSDLFYWDYVWVGGSDIALESNWVWTDGSAVVYDNWGAYYYADEPDYVYDCMLLESSGEWGTWMCDDTYYFVCMTV